MFDFSRPFFEQFRELFLSVPKLNLVQDGEMINSDFTQFTGWLKNCYMAFDCGKTEDTLYTVLGVYCKKVIDVFHGTHLENSYECINVQNSQNMFYAKDSNNCSFGAFLEACESCQNCLGCVNLKNKSYNIFNEQVSKEVFETIWKEIFSGKSSSIQDFLQKFDAFKKKSFFKNLRNIQSINCI